MTNLLQPERRTGGTTVSGALLQLLLLVFPHQQKETQRWVGISFCRRNAECQRSAGRGLFGPCPRGRPSNRMAGIRCSECSTPTHAALLATPLLAVAPGFHHPWRRFDRRFLLLENQEGLSRREKRSPILVVFLRRAGG